MNVLIFLLSKLSICCNNAGPERTEVSQAAEGVRSTGPPQV